MNPFCNKGIYKQSETSAHEAERTILSSTSTRGNILQSLICLLAHLLLGKL